MPLYEYRCNNCMSLIQVTRSYTERETDIICPKCDRKTSRVYHAPGMRQRKQDTDTDSDAIRDRATVQRIRRQDCGSLLVLYCRE